MYKHKITTLKNGLRLVTSPMPQVDSVTVMVGVGAGSRYETKSINGLFHFIEHMAFKGTKRRPSTLDIASEVDAVGGEFNAFTDKEFTAYFIKLASKHKELAFDILSDMLSNSLFKPEEIEREKGVIIEEINMRQDIPLTQVLVEFERLLYGDNPMGWDIGGRKDSVRQIKQEDFLKYINRLYFPKNMVIAVAGKIDREEISKLTGRYFSQLKRKGKKRTKTIKQYQKTPKTKLIYKKTEQSHFCLGVPGYWYSHPDRFAIGVLSAILGGGMSSRLFIQIRERRGLAYYVKSDIDYSTDSGFLLCRAGVRLKKIEESIKVCLEEFEKFITQRVEAKELTKAKEMLKGNFILSLEDSKNVAGRYVTQLILEKKIRTPQKAMELIDKVTPEDIQRVAKDIFKSKNLNLAIIGPYKDEARFKKLLKK
ncbi:insulinase family protein [Patescibacteria group bacterium]|nr:insulinase family protein [Patescibacteria group bacterium]